MNSAELLDLQDTDPEAYEAEMSRRHADRYPNGCGRGGHACQRCFDRLPELATQGHMKRVKAGARAGYKGSFECLDCRNGGKP